MGRRLYSVLAVCFAFTLLIGCSSSASAASTATLTPASYNFGTFAVGSGSAWVPFTLTNTGTASMTVSGATVTGPFVVYSQCGSSLAAGKTCITYVYFEPTTTSAASGTLTLTDGAGTQTSALSGNSGSTSCATVPSASTLSDSSITTTGFKLSWTVPTEGAGCTLTGYTVHIGTSTYSVAAGTTTYTATGLTAGTTYSVYVTAANSDGSTNSNTLSVTTSPALVCATAPGALTLSDSAITSSGVALSWTVPTEGTNCTLSGYTVHVGTSTYAVAAGTTTYTVSGLTASTAYSIYVTATNNDTTTNSNTVSITTLPAPVCTTAPGAFTLSDASVTSSGVKLSWTVPTEGTNCTLSGYEVYQGGVAKVAVAAGTTTYTVTGLTAGSTYSFDIAATNSDGVTDSNTVSVTTTPSCAAVPSAPTVSAATSITSSGATLNWSAVTPPANCSITSYSVFENGSTTALATGITTASYAVTGLAASTSYTFTVKALDSFGTSAASASIPVTTLAGTVPPTNVFAPFEYVGDLSDANQLNPVVLGSGVKAVILAFLVPASSGCNLEWPGASAVLPNDTIGSTSVGTEIAALQAAGIEVAISQGGYGGQDASAFCTTAATTQAVYQQLINQYHINWLDFDIEWTEKSGQSVRRAQALAALQTANPGLKISYTLPSDTPGDGLPDGLDQTSNGGTTDITNAVTAGVKLTYINAMTMDFGNTTTDQATLAEQAGAAVAAWLKSQNITATVGLTVLPGQSDTAGAVVFSLADATALTTWAQSNSEITLLSFWEQNRDNGSCAGVAGDQDTCSGLTQTTYEFSGIFEAF